MELLHRRIEHLLDDARQSMDLVDEQDVSGIAVRSDRRQIPGALDGGAARDADLAAHLVRDAIGGRRLPDPGRPVQQDVLERLLAQLRGLEQDAKVALDGVLVDVVGVVETPRSERELEMALLVARLRRGETLLPASASASRPATTTFTPPATRSRAPRG